VEKISQKLYRESLKISEISCYAPLITAAQQHIYLAVLAPLEIKAGLKSVAKRYITAIRALIEYCVI
jgi:hypothetical protein